MVYRPYNRDDLVLAGIMDTTSKYPAGKCVGRERIIAAATRTGVDVTLAALTTPRPEEEWHEDMGPMLWWRFPIEEAPYCGSPLNTEWPGYHTHFTPIPMPAKPWPEG